jgi:glycosyltransferase involved in cell wall biosynthesis
VPSLLFVAFQSFGFANGGVESVTQILDAVRDWPRTVVTQTETRFSRRWRDMGCDVLVWPTAPYDRTGERPSVQDRIARGLGVARYNARLARLVRDRRIDVVHANDIASFWHAGMGAKAAGARVVFNVRSIFPDEVPYGPKWSLIHHLADEVVSLSQEMHDVVMARFPPTFGSRLPVASTSVVYTGIDLERHRPAGREERIEVRRMLGIPQDAFAVGHVARVWEIKNQLPLLQRAVPRLMEAVPNAHVYFVGDVDTARDDYGRACLEAVRGQPWADRVHWVGFVEDPIPWLRAVDASVLVSRYEGLARAMIESLACGTPMVSFDVTSAREILADKGGGIAVPRGDYEGIASALVGVASDRVRLAALGERARRIAETHFDHRSAAREYRALYSRLAGEGVTARRRSTA